MEPRPPRPRTQGPPDRTAHTPTGPGPTGGSAYGPGVGGYPGVQTGGPVAYGPEQTAPQFASEIPLVPRQERRRRRVARGAAMLLVLLVGVGALGLVFRDRLLGGGDDGRAVPAGMVSPTAIAADGPGAASATSPTPARRTVASLLATATATATSAAPTPTVAASEPTAPATRPTRTPAAAANGAAADEVPLDDLLPTAAEVPEGMAVVEEGERSQDEVAAAIGGTEEASQLLTDWGWEGNLYRNFEAPDAAELPPGTTTALNVSIHRFATPDAASEALTYFSDYVIALQGLTEFDLGQPVGDEVRALQGAPEGSPLVVLYLREGATMFRIGGSSNSPDGDPTDDVLALAETVLAQ